MVTAGATSPKMSENGGGDPLNQVGGDENIRRAVGDALSTD